MRIPRTAKSAVKAALPKPLLILLRSLRSRRRQLERQMEPLVTEEQLCEDLRSAGIQAGDVLMVHSALSKIGNVDGGAETVIRALIAVVSPGGTIAMPCYASGEDVEKGMADARYVDLRTLGSGTGKITEAFRNWPGVLRSSHPFSSMCALGKEASFLLRDHARAPHVCHRDSPVGRLVQLDAKVLGIGVPIGRGFGIAHHLEDTWKEFPLSVHRPPFRVRYINAEGEIVEREVIRFDPAVARTRIDQPDGAWINDQFTKHLTRLGVLRHFTFGNAPSWLIRAGAQHHEVKRLAEKGITMYMTREEFDRRGESLESW